MSLYLGIMSGTSLDGIDLALVDFSRNAQLIYSAQYPYPEKIKHALLPLSQGEKVSLFDIGTVDRRLGLCYADAVNQFISENNIDKQQIKAIGCHGQTVFHQPDGADPFSMQLGDANLIAVKTGLKVVADFRRKDMAFGGQGAPLVPAFHQAIFATADCPRVIVNIGGIANITCLIPDNKVLGYDTGPGNMLMDSWIQQQKNLPYDDNGQWAASGKVNQPLLQRFLADEYFALNAPKSTGRERFHQGWLDGILVTMPAISAQDVQASLLALTAISISNEVSRLPSGELLVCGGGARNQQLMQALRASLPTWQVMSTTEKGVDADSLEAMAFAWLAFRTLHNKPGNLPSVTGASQACVLGAIYSPD